ncbi:MAG: CesT family type III secretion system chaperone [Methylocystaceae bacterium]|nr:CesT family type III secretion system chaperone [Methylocystaceae bacterium]
MNPFESILTEFAKHVNLEEINDFLKYHVLIVDNISIEFVHHSDSDGDYLLLVADLGQVPIHARGTVYKYLLSANLVFQGTGGSTLGIHAETDNVIQTFAVPNNALEPEKLTDIVKGFVDVAEYWRSSLENWRENDVNTDDDLPEQFFAELNAPQAPTSSSIAYADQFIRG